MARALPKCTAHPDCFANGDGIMEGVCVALRDTTFRKRLASDKKEQKPTGPEYSCPFYKPKSQITREQIEKDIKIYTSTKLKED